VTVPTAHPSTPLLNEDALAAAYGVLARVLLGPAGPELLDQLSAPGQLDAWPMARDEPTRLGLRLVAESLATGEGNDELAADYARLFVGPGHVLASPYESVHVTVDRLLFDVPTFQVRAAYQAFGLSAPRLNQEPDDHLGLELAFLAQLCLLTMESTARGDGAEVERLRAAHRQFLTEHVLRFGPACLDAVAAHAQTAFYRGFAALGAGLLAQAAEQLP
jgi:putative dimethyl sulfoxide reductase chaperone